MKRDRLIILLVIANVTALGAIAASNRTPDVLRVRGIEIVDDRGVVRVRIAAPLPDPIDHGRVSKRDAPLSGILIYDATGSERGGYATDDDRAGGNALLTLDSVNDQVVTLVAYPRRGAELGVTRSRGNAAVL